MEEDTGTHSKVKLDMVWNCKTQGQTNNIRVRLRTHENRNRKETESTPRTRKKAYLTLCDQLNQIATPPTICVPT